MKKKSIFKTWAGKAAIFGIFLCVGLVVSHYHGGGTMQGGVLLPGAKAGACTQTNKQSNVTLSITTLASGISLEKIVQGSLTALIQPAVAVLCDSIDSVSSNGGDDFLFGTGGRVTYGNKTVIDWWTYMRNLAEAALALVIAIVGVQIILGRSPRVLLPRIVFSFLAIFAFWQLLPKIIDLESVIAGQILNLSLNDLVASFTQGIILTNVLSLLFLPLILFFALLLILQMWARVGLLDLLIVLSPVFLLCYSHPSSQRWANTWVSLFLVTLLVQPIQLLVLAIGVGLMNIFNSGSFVAMCIGISILFMILKIPGWMSATVGNAFGSVPDTLYRVAQVGMRIASFALGGSAGAARFGTGAGAFGGGIMQGGFGSLQGGQPQGRTGIQGGLGTVQSGQPQGRTGMQGGLGAVQSGQPQGRSGIQGGGLGTLQGGQPQGRPEMQKGFDTVQSGQPQGGLGVQKGPGGVLGRPVMQSGSGIVQGGSPQGGPVPLPIVQNPSGFGPLPQSPGVSGSAPLPQGLTSGSGTDGVPPVSPIPLKDREEEKEPLLPIDDKEDEL